MAPRPLLTLDDALDLIHSASRAIARDPDRILARRGLGRVHQRVLYQCRRHADLSVGALRTLLGVSKQALHRPLADLQRDGLVVAEVDPDDRRARRLRLTARGRTLEQRLSQAQRDELTRAFATVGDEGLRWWARVMSELGGATGRR